MNRMKSDLKWKVTEDIKHFINAIRLSSFEEKIVENDFIQLTSWYLDVQRKYSIGHLDQKTFRYEFNKIKSGIFETIDRMNEDDIEIISAKMKLIDSATKNKNTSDKETSFAVGIPVHEKSKNFYVKRSIEDVIYGIIENSSGNIITLKGSRRTGKTSMLYNLQKKLEFDLYDVVLTNCSYLDWPRFENHIKKTLQLDIKQKNLKDRITDKLQESNKHLIFMLDEITYFDQAGGESIIDFLLDLRQKCKAKMIDITIIIVYETPVYEMTEVDNLSNAFTVLEVGHITKEDLKASLENSSLKITENQLATIYEYTGGVPFLLSLLLDQIHYKNEETELSEVTIIEAAKSIVQESDYLLSYLIKEFLNEESDDVINKLLDLDSGNLDVSTIKSLVEIGVLKKERGRLRFSSKIHRLAIEKMIG